MIIITSPPEYFSGQLKVPGDKSITHRALMLGAISRGVTEIKGFLDAEDCRATINCLRLLGVKINVRGNRLLIEGRGMYLKKASKALDAGNSGTTARLMLGILAGQDFETTISGDQYLQRRPMKRIVEPLQSMGALFEGESDRLPITIKGGELAPLNYKTPRASAQIKSAILLAALYAEGVTTVAEPYQSRNHTELMLAQFGANISVNERLVTLEGRPALEGRPVRVPGDMSAAAFFMAAAVLVPDSEVLLKDVGINPARRGVIDVLFQMGADIEIQQERRWGSEPVADILIRGGSPLKGVEIGGAMIPRLIDEIPALAVVAAAAEGETVIRDADELRVKESDRISDLAGQLLKLGVNITETEDGMIIKGEAGLKGADVESCGDHRLAMALAVAGLAAEGETAVYGAEIINVSFPGFMPALRSLIIK